MRKQPYNSFVIGILTLSILFPVSCSKNKITQGRYNYTYAIPIYRSLSQVRANMKNTDAISIKNSGKIYVQGKYIFLNEVDKGIHVIDNSIPSSPRNLSFISIPGNEDMAIKGSTLYADSYNDLVAIDISDPLHIAVRKIVDNAFPDRSMYYKQTGTGVYNYISDSAFTNNPDSLFLVADWVTRDTVIDYPIYYGSPPYYTAALAPGNSQNKSNGTGGSMARFTVVNNYLYTVNNATLNVFNVQTSDNPVLTNHATLAWNIETIYPFQDKLLIGSTDGVYVFDINASPEQPVQTGQFAHVRACDPVIADDKYVYSTISTGNACIGTQNELDILDIKSIRNPMTGGVLQQSPLLAAYPMSRPLGLAKDGSTLFICDGDAGLKIYNATDIHHLRPISQFNILNAYDVIAMKGLAIVVTSSGLYQYNYSDLQHIQLLSKM